MFYMVRTRTAGIQTESWMWEGLCGVERKVFCDCQNIDWEAEGTRVHNWNDGGLL